MASLRAVLPASEIPSVPGDPHFSLHSRKRNVATSDSIASLIHRPYCQRSLLAQCTIFIMTPDLPNNKSGEIFRIEKDGLRKKPGPLAFGSQGLAQAAISHADGERRPPDRPWSHRSSPRPTGSGPVPARPIPSGGPPGAASDPGRAAVRPRTEKFGSGPSQGAFHDARIGI